MAEPAAFLLWAVICFVFFQNNYQYHFYYQEQNQLFLLTQDYIAEYCNKDAPLALLIGDFLTQFYYLRYAGALILTASLLLMGVMLRFSLSLTMGLSAKISAKVKAVVPALVALVVMTIFASLALKITYRLADLWSAVGWAIMICVYEIITIPLFKKQEATPSMKQWKVCGAITGVVAALTAGFASFAFGNPLRGEFSKPEHSIERLLAYDNEYYFGNYNRVMQMGIEDGDSISDDESFLYYLSVVQVDNLASHMNDLKNVNLGTFTQIGPETPLFTIKSINELYWLLGDMTYAERAAMMALTFSPDNRNVRMVKRLAEINLVKNDIPAARKYLRILEKTMFYKQWAADHTPETMTPEVKADIARRQKVQNTCKGIRLGDNCRVILLQLLESNPQNRIALDYLLCSDILAREIVTFHNDYVKYGSPSRPEYQQIEQYYQQNAPEHQ